MIFALYTKYAGNTPKKRTYKTNFSVNKSKDSLKLVCIEFRIMLSSMTTLYVSIKYAVNDETKRSNIKIGFVVYFELISVSKKMVKLVKTTLREAKKSMFSDEAS